jgi:hypothetical protein
MKKLSLESRLRRNLRMGKACKVRFRKMDGSLTIRWVKAIPVEKIKGTGKSSKSVICFYDIQKQDIICCKTEFLFDVQTKAQFDTKLAKKEAAKERADKAREIMKFYGCGFSDAIKIVIDKKSLAIYERDAKHEETYF